MSVPGALPVHVTDRVPAVEDRIKRQALALGFSAVGIARAEPLTSEGDRLRQWLARGYDATMQWMARRSAERVDPGVLLPGARSLVVVAMNYYDPASHSSDPGHGKISRYAWGDDYHEVLGAPLRRLEQWMLEEFPGIRTKAYVDTGPVMEKAWGQRAGIGWVGKHTTLITPQHGSWVFLGELLTTLELDGDAPATDHCGTCTLCLEACPTGAIVEPYVLDSERCISYLTIEHRGKLPSNLAGQLAGWIYGCDLCQEVCPWNQRFAEPCQKEEFAPRPGMLAPELSTWAQMSDEEFDTMFERSAVKRTRAEGLRRNVRAVLGAAADPGGADVASQRID